MNTTTSLVGTFTAHTMVILGLMDTSIGHTITLEIGLPITAKFGVKLNGLMALLPLRLASLQ